MGRPIIFISHISAEREVATILRKALEELFPDAEVFVSDPAIRGGSSWFEKIRRSLVEADVILVSVSKASQSDPWILFEAGAGIEKQKSIPIIWNEMEFSDLKAPLSCLQARKLNRPDEFRKLLSDISAHASQMRAPWNEKTYESLRVAISGFTLPAPATSTVAVPTEEVGSVLHTLPNTFWLKPVVPDYDCSEANKKLANLADRILNRKINQLKPIHPDLPESSELENLGLFDKYRLVDSVNGFKTMELMEFMSVHMRDAPPAGVNPIIKRKFLADTDERISKLTKIAARNKISLI